MWGLGCLAAGLLMDGHQVLKPFQEQALAVQLGAWLGLLAFVIAAIFSCFLLVVSLRTKSIQKPMQLLPWACKSKAPSVLAFRTCCIVCATAFLIFCAMFLSAILA